MLKWKRALLILLMLAMACTAPALGEAVVESVEEPIPETSLELGGEETAEANDFEDETEPTTVEYGTLTLTRESAVLGKGEKLHLLPEDWQGATLPTFSLSKKKIVTVSATGEVVAKKKGTVTVTAQWNGEVASCQIKVVSAPKTISLGVSGATLGYDEALGFGESLTLSPALTKNTASAISWDYDPGILDVSLAGENLYELKAVGVGTTKLTAATFNNKKASMTVTVLPAPTEAVFAEDPLLLCAGESYAPQVLFNEGSGSGVFFTSSDSGCVQVESDGKLTALSEGTAQITASCFNGVQATCTVNVTRAPTEVFVEQPEIKLGVGEDSAPIAAHTDVEDAQTTFHYTSSRVKAATVNENGVIHGAKKGSATIKVAAGNGVSASVKVTVLAAPKSVSLSPKSMNLGLGEIGELKAVLPSKSWSNVWFESSDPDVAGVDAEGYVTGLSSGSAVIVAHTHNGKTASCPVTVFGPAAQIILDDEIQMSVRQTMALPVTVLDEAGGIYPGEAQVSFDDGDIAEYQDGKLRALKAGQTVMTVMAGGLVKTCLVTVEGTATTGRTLAIAHRGGCGPETDMENTLAAFRQAASKGADGVEIDARSTKDGYQVIHHDATFKVNGKKYTLSKIKLSELRKLRPEVPTLDEALDVLDATGLDIHLELKDTADGAKCVQAVREHGLEGRTVYFSFYEKQLKQVYKADPTVELGMSIKADVKYNGSSLLKKIDSLHLTFLVAHKDLMTQTVTDYWHDMGLKISVWTPDEPSELKKLCDMGVDYILTNYPERCAKYL